MLQEESDENHRINTLKMGSTFLHLIPTSSLVSLLGPPFYRLQELLLGEELFPHEELGKGFPQHHHQQIMLSIEGEYYKEKARAVGREQSHKE